MVQELALRRQIETIIQKTGKDPGFELTWLTRQEIMARYNFAAQFIKPGERILDLGCGLGLGLKKLTLAGEVLAVDFVHQRAVETLKNTKRDPKIKVLQMDATDLGLPTCSFDKIVAMEVIEHIPDYPKMLAEVCRILKDDGTLILSTPNFDVTQEIVHGEHVKEFRSEELRGILQEHFEKIEVFGLGRTKHSFSGAYSQARQSFLYPLYRSLPRAVRSLIQYPAFRLCYGPVEVKPFNPQEPSPILIAVCQGPKNYDTQFSFS